MNLYTHTHMNTAQYNNGLYMMLLGGEAQSERQNSGSGGRSASSSGALLVSQCLVCELWAQPLRSQT